MIKDWGYGSVWVCTHTYTHACVRVCPCARVWSKILIKFFNRRIFSFSSGRDIGKQLKRGKTTQKFMLLVLSTHPLSVFLYNLYYYILRNLSDDLCLLWVNRCGVKGESFLLPLTQTDTKLFLLVLVQKFQRNSKRHVATVVSRFITKGSPSY